MNKTVIITGTSSGIGKAAVKAFSDKGWNVAATMRTPSKGADMANWKNVKVYALDVTKEASIHQAFDQVQKDFGSIDVVVNNAGYGVDGVFEAMSDDVIERQFDTNVFGLMRVTRKAIEVMRAQGGGNIIQIASMGGRLAFPLYSIYHASKWAVEGFSESLQYELKPFNIHVKVVEPGAIKTEFYGEGREFIQPNDDDAYGSFVEKVTKVAMDAGAKGEPASKVAQTIVKAAEDKSNRLRFVVGSPAPIILRLKRWLPNTMFFKLIRSSYKI